MGKELFSRITLNGQWIISTAKRNFLAMDVFMNILNIKGDVEMKKLIIILMPIFIMTSSCKKKDEKKVEAIGTKKTSEIVIPKEVKKAWKSLKIELRNKESNNKKVYEIEIGSRMKLDDTGLTVEVMNFAPDFKMSPGEITSASAEPKNPAAQVLIEEEGKQPIKVWLFYNYPDVHAFVHPKYQLALVGFIKSE